MSVEEHRKASPKQVDYQVITVSDTRGSKEDISGDLIVEKLAAADHLFGGRSWTKDKPEEICKAQDEVENAYVMLIKGLCAGHG